MNEKALIAIITLAGLLSACAHHQQEIDTTNLHSLQQAYAEEPKRDEIASAESSRMRFKMLQDTAMSLGAQGGLAATYEQIDINLEKDKKHLENIFNFNGMMLSHGVLPPVLVEGDNSLNQDNPDTIRIADKTYKIVLQARFVTTPPNWREYLYQTYDKPEMPNKILLPKSKEEREIWSKYIKLGWERGVQQAYSIFQQNLARLKRDYQGMILYRKLLQEKMISAPYVSKAELGITGNGDDMRINDQVLRITVHPQLQTDSSNWKAIVVKQDDNS
jgi:defect in organelle trafficking protein DotC